MMYTIPDWMHTDFSHGPRRDLNVGTTIEEYMNEVLRGNLNPIDPQGMGGHTPDGSRFPGLGVLKGSGRERAFTAQKFLDEKRAKEQFDMSRGLGRPAVLKTDKPVSTRALEYLKEMDDKSPQGEFKLRNLR